MKRLLTSAIALSLLASAGAAAAQPHHDDRNDHRYEQNRNDHHDNRNNHRWARGQRMPSTYYHDRGHYVDYRTYRLRAPPRGYQWVRTDDNNFAMVAITTGLIATLIAANH